MESSVLLVLPIYKVFIGHLNMECFESTVPAIFRFYAPTFFLPILGTHGHWPVRVLSRATSALTWAYPYDSYLRGPCCRAFGSGAVTTCLYDLGLSRLGIEPRSHACEAIALPLRHRGGLLVYEHSRLFK